MLALFKSNVMMDKSRGELERRERSDNGKVRDWENNNNNNNKKERNIIVES